MTILLIRNEGATYQSTERISRSLAWPNHFGEPEVHYLQIGIITGIYHEYVFKFQISVSDTVAVQIIQCSSQLMNDIPGPILCNLEIPLIQVLKEVST